MINPRVREVGSPENQALSNLLTQLGNNISDALSNIYNSNGDLTDSIGKISDATGLSPQEVAERIHNAKKNRKRPPAPPSQPVTAMI